MRQKTVICFFTFFILSEEKKRVQKFFHTKDEWDHSWRGSFFRDQGTGGGEGEYSNVITK
jgi:hypothetical protein